MEPQRRLQGENESVEEPPVPTIVYCGAETSVSPGRIKLGLYGYTWGKDWQVRGDYVFYQWRLCFDGIRAWYVNQEESGDGVLGTDEPLRAIDMQQEGRIYVQTCASQEDGRPLTLWFPQFYMTGDHLACRFQAGLLWEHP